VLLRDFKNQKYLAQKSHLKVWSRHTNIIGIPYDTRWIYLSLKETLTTTKSNKGREKLSKLMNCECPWQIVENVLDGEFSEL